MCASVCACVYACAQHMLSAMRCDVWGDTSYDGGDHPARWICPLISQTHTLGRPQRGGDNVGHNFKAPSKAAQVDSTLCMVLLALVLA